MWKILGLSLLVVFASCTKKPAGTVVSGEPLVSPVSDPNRIIFDAMVTLPAEHKGKLKRTDVLIWDLKDGKGDVLASQIIPVPSFPHHLTVQARQLQRATPESTTLLFAARVAHFGEERKPPAKGQLNVLVGVVPSKDEVQNPNVDQKRFAKWAKKNNVVEEKVLKIGSKVEASLTPSLW
ncbi:MAG: hypothetical protein AB7K68_08655 [Bacteriovoracia bacterium]